MHNLTSPHPADHWRASAACATADPELFFGSDRESLSGRIVRTARALACCRGCPVMAVCAAWAVAEGIRDGIWGGMSEERLRILVPAPAAVRLAANGRAFAAERAAAVVTRLATGRKRCPGCQQVLSLEGDFGRDSRSTDGRTARCRECRKRAAA